MADPLKPQPAVRVAKEEPNKSKQPTQDNPSGLPGGRHPENKEINQLADPAVTTNPKEPPMPSKRDQPGLPLEDDPHFQIQTIVNDIHRGVYPEDLKDLPADKKAKLLAAMDAESESERVYRDPSRELTRERMRETLGAKRRDGRTERPPQKPKP